MYSWKISTCLNASYFASIHKFILHHLIYMEEIIVGFQDLGSALITPHKETSSAAQPYLGSDSKYQRHCDIWPREDDERTTNPAVSNWSAVPF